MNEYVYVAFEVFERELREVAVESTLDDAVARANDMLRKYVKGLSPLHERMLDSIERDFRRGLNDGEGVGACIATTENRGAWCNWYEQKYDVHIAAIAASKIREKEK